MKRVVPSLLAAILLSIPAWALAAPECESMYIDVAMAQGEPATQSIYAELCARGNPSGKPIQILVHGGSYDHRYWDPDFDKKDDHSYVKYITKHGYATLNIDRVGSGRSSRPADPSTLNFGAAAFTIHQIVQKLRQGTLDSIRFGTIQSNTIVLVGFSFGAMIATVEASTYNDVDALILQSYSHTVGPAGEASFDLAYPANLEPRFSGISDNYMTTLPGVRPDLFFYTPGTTPFILATDEVWKQTYALAELLDIFPSLGASFGVQVPTLLVVGDYDLISCEAPSCSAAGSLNDEWQNFPMAASFDVEIIDGAGHTLNWHKNPKPAFHAMRKWAKRTLRR